MGNFIDKTFTVIADILLKVLPASKQEKEAFSYYRSGMAAQSQGKYAEALENYYEALQVEEDPYDSDTEDPNSFYNRRKKIWT